MHRINKKQDISHLMSGGNERNSIYVCSDSKTIREGFNLGKMLHKIYRDAKKLICHISGIKD